LWDSLSRFEKVLIKISLSIFEVFMLTI